MLIKIFDAAIPLSGAIIFWLLYTERLPIKKNKDAHKILYKKYKKLFLACMIALLLVSILNLTE